MALCAMALATACSNMRVSQNPQINAAAFQANPPRSLAILPFHNSSGKTNADDIARRSVFAAFTSHGYEDVDLARVDEKLSELGLQSNLRPDELPPSIILKSGVADALLVGDVEAVSKFWFPFYSHINVRLNLQVKDSRTGQTLYANEARGLNMRLDPPLSIPGLVGGAFQTLWHLRGEEMEQTMDRFTKRLAVDFPNVEHATGEATSNIRNVKLTVPRDPLRAGDEIKLEFRGTPRKKAFFDLGAVERNIPIAEIQPGRYGVRYQIKQELEAEYCVVRCRLVDGKDTVEVSLFRQPFSIKAKGSGRLQIEEAVLTDSSLLLRASAEIPSPAAYVFYRSEDPKTDFSFVGRSEEPVCEDRRIQPGKAYYYYARSIDKAGEESPPSPLFTYNVPPRGPVSLTGQIDADASLQAYSSPYVVTGRLVVSPGAELTIQPGAELQFSEGGALEVRGRIKAVGRPGNPVTFRSRLGWDGLILGGGEKPGDQMIENAVIEKAKCGIRVEGGTLSARGISVREGQTGVWIAESARASLLSCSFNHLTTGVETRSPDASLQACEFRACAQSVVVGGRGGKTTITHCDFFGPGVAVRNLASSPLPLEANYFATLDPLQLIKRNAGWCEINQIYDAPVKGGSPRPFGTEPIETIVRRGDMLASAGKNEASIQEYAKALTRKKDRYAYLRIVPLLRLRGDSDSAFSLSQSAAYIFPGDADVLLLHAESLFQRGLRSEAESLLKKVDSLPTGRGKADPLRQKYP